MYNILLANLMRPDPLSSGSALPAFSAIRLYPRCMPHAYVLHILSRQQHATRGMQHATSLRGSLKSSPRKPFAVHQINYYVLNLSLRHKLSPEPPLYCSTPPANGGEIIFSPFLISNSKIDGTFFRLPAAQWVSATQKESTVTLALGTLKYVFKTKYYWNLPIKQ